MFSIQKPTDETLSKYLSIHRQSPFTYDEVEGTRTEPPAGFTCGRQRVCLGNGQQVYLKAKQDLRDWKMFPADFASVIWPCPIEVGRVVATLFRAPCFWTLNPCRIIYTVDETKENVDRFGFAYGTVGKHLACGEERFTVEHNHNDDTVWYEVYCFSKANHWLAKVAYPYLRFQQNRFRKLSARAMMEGATEKNFPNQEQASAVSA